MSLTPDEEQDAAQALDPNPCCHCEEPQVEQGYALPLCPACRTSLARAPLPLWITATGAATGVMLAIALTRFPGSLSAGVAYERGQRAERAGQYGRAVAEYEHVVARFPESTEAVARLGIAHYRSGHLMDAAKTLDKLGGKEAPSEELATEVNQVMDEIVKKLEPAREKQR